MYGSILNLKLYCFTKILTSYVQIPTFQTGFVHFPRVIKHGLCGLCLFTVHSMNYVAKPLPELGIHKISLHGRGKLSVHVEVKLWTSIYKSNHNIWPWHRKLKKCKNSGGSKIFRKKRVVKVFEKKLGVQYFVQKNGGQRFAQKCFGAKNFAKKNRGSNILRKQLGVTCLAK